MSVYIITDRQMGAAKIGFSGMPKKRLTMLKTASPSMLLLEAVIPGDMTCEKALHSRFSAQKLRGEWFAISPEIDDLIKTFPIGKKFRKSALKTDASNTLNICDEAMQKARDYVASGKSQAELARASGVHRNTIAKIGPGWTPTYSTIRKIAAGLEVLSQDATCAPRERSAAA